MRDRDDIEREIQQHLEDRYDELRASGLSHDAACRDAAHQLRHLTRQLDALGPRAPADTRRDFQLGATTMPGSLWQDAKYALRCFMKSPGFASVIIVTLALGIGATTAIFSVLDGVLLRPLPYPDVDRILRITERRTDGRSVSVAWPDFQDWKSQATAFDHLGVYRSESYNITGGEQPERLVSALASSGVFGALGLPPLLGRSFGPAEDAPAAERVVLISERLWRNRFNADRALVGRTIALNAEPYTVVGVMPSAMRFPSRLTDVWVPLGLFVDSMPPRGAHPGLTAIAKLKAGTSRARAVAELDAIALQLAQQYPESNETIRASVVPYYEQVVSNIRPAVLVLIGAVAAVLLVACANLANLMMSRAETRHREIAVRAALGAGRRRILQQLLVESLMLASAGGTMGALLAWWAVRAFVAAQPASVPRIDTISVDLRVLAFTAVISLATGVLFGLWPALRASAPDLLTSLKESVRGTAGAASRRLRSALVVAEVSLALMLLVGAGLMIRSFERLTSVELGFNPERVVTSRITLPDKRYPDTAAWTAFHRELLRRAATLPGVESVGISSAVPLEGGGSEAPVIAEDDAMPGAGHPVQTTQFQAISPDYLRAMDIRLVAGRPFTDRDRADSSRVAIVDDLLVSRLFPGGDPVGKRIAFEFRGHGPHAGPSWREVVGVVRHVRHYSVAAEQAFVQVYTPYEQLPGYVQPPGPSMAIAARTTLRPQAFAASLGREVAAIDPDVPVYGTQTMEEYVARDTEQRRLSMMLLSGFGGLALLLAVVGVYGVLSYSVSQRTQEIGIRMALGATRGDVLALVMGQALRLTAIGLGIGLAGAYAGGRLLTALLYEVSPRDPATFVALTLLLSAAAVAASLLPGLRATRVSPIDALRSD